MYTYIFAHLICALIFVPSTLYAAQFQLQNPIQFPSIGEFVRGLLRVLITILLPVISFFIVLSGFYFVSARGNVESINKAKKNFMYVLIGAAMLLGASAFFELLDQTVGQIQGK